jgi:UDP-N-acetylmuramoyl-tripeptide--D-alanyl-D-alanine ligase
MNIEALYQLYRQHPNVQTDTRKLQSGDLFFALRGPSFNGNAFAAKAIEAGAAMAVIDDAAYAIEGRTFLVNDVLTALQELALHHRKRFDIPFLAITGSNGKTTTKELIHAVLATTFRTYTTEGNLNNHIGVPLTLLKIRPDAQMAVVEMGANHQKEIESYCRYTLPTHGLITNVGKAHLEGFGGEEGVRKGKGELFDHLRSTQGTVFIMSDYDYLQEMSAGIGKVVRYGTREGEVVGQAIAGTDMLAVALEKGMEGRIQTQLVGDYNLPNVLAAVAVGLHFGVAPEQIRSALETYTPTNSRSQLLRRGSNRIILDAYNANPSSMRAAIQNFAKSDTGNKILLLGAMAELGPQSLEEHEGVVNEIARHSWKDVALVGGDFQKLKTAYRHFATPEEAGQWLREQQPAHSSLLIKGSRSMKMEKLLEYINHD